MVPQWDFLSLLADAGAQEKTFDLRIAHRGHGLLREGNTVVGGVTHAADGMGGVARRPE